MSGRVHVFLYHGEREKIEELAQELGLPQEERTWGHLLKEGASDIYDLWKAGSIPQELTDKLTQVSQPTLKLERKVTVFLNEGTIRKLDELEVALGIDHFDSSHSHLMQAGLDIIYDKFKKGALTTERTDVLKTVFVPKFVYHS